MAGRIGCQAIGQVDCRSLVELGCLLQRRGGRGSHSFVGMRKSVICIFEGKWSGGGVGSRLAMEVGFNGSWKTRCRDSWVIQLLDHRS